MPPSSSFQKNCIALAIGQSILAPVLVNAATINVNTASDVVSAQNCTLREAIAITNSGNPNVESNGCTVVGTLGSNDQINFNLPGSNTIELSRGQLEITSTVSINGPGAELLVIDGNAQSRVMRISGAGANGTTIDGLSLTGGLISSDVPFSLRQGAGLYVSNAPSVSLSNSIVSNNQGAADNLYGVGISIVNSPNATLIDVVISNNTGVGESYGGGVRVDNSNNVRLESVTISDNTSALRGGLDVHQSDNVVIVDSIINNNYADPDGATGGFSSAGGVSVSNSDNVVIENTTISANTATTYGGGLDVFSSDDLLINRSTISNNLATYGAGVEISSSNRLTITNSTISSNTANQFYNQYLADTYYADGAGIRIFRGSSVFNNVTISDNRAIGSNAVTGGIRVNASAYAPSLVNTVVANNIGGDCNVNLLDTTASWFSDASCNGSADGDPSLGPLSDNGGDTLTHAPLAGSGLIDAGDVSACQNQANGVDQLDEPRGESACTIGAVEANGQAEETFFVVPLDDGKVVIFGL